MIPRESRHGCVSLSRRGAGDLGKGGLGRGGQQLLLFRHGIKREPKERVSELALGGAERMPNDGAFDEHAAA
jgi:hypothetical protein